MRRSLIAGNWKMNGTRQTVTDLVTSLKQGCSAVDVDWAVLAPSVFLDLVQAELTGSVLHWGAQTVSEHTSGAFTGEISASMLQDFGCQYVTVGHSERRQLFGESNAAVAAKFVSALKMNISPILCVGETLAQRESGITLQIVQEQLAVALSLQDNLPELKSAVIAYEPVWAIGTGLSATPDQAETVHAAIRAQLAEYDAELAASMRILYGGSVKPENAAALFSQPNIDGALVGGASLDAEQFIAIGRACNS